MITSKKELLTLIMIVLVGLVLRVVFITNSPPSLYGDELTITLDSYSLLITGQDELGNPWPLTFPMGAGRPAGYVYGSMPFIAIFGPTALGVRALSILSGIGIIILLYFVGRKLFSGKVGLLGAVVGAVSPWDISLSRGGFEAHFALFLALLGTYLFMLAKQKPLMYVLAALSFGLTLHTYPTYKVSLLLFLPLLFWYVGETKEVLKEKYFFSGVVVFVILGILALSQTFIGGSELRFSNINIFSSDNLQSVIEQKIDLDRQISNLPKVAVKYFYNKPVEYSKTLIENYLQNFSMDFLVLHGDRNPRHNMATTGEIYFAEVILIFIGLLGLWQKQKKALIFLILWILIAPLPTAVIDLPHALRSSFMLPPLAILSALGLLKVLNYRSKKALYLVLLIFIIQLIFFLQKLYFLAPNEYSNFWSYPAKLAAKLAIENKDNYQYVILSDKIDSIEYAYPVYARVSPVSVISQNKQVAPYIAQNKKITEINAFKKFGNVYIGKVDNFDTLRSFTQNGASVLFIAPYEDRRMLLDYEIIQGLNKLNILVIEKNKQ